MPRREAVISGAMEVFPAVLVATLTTVFAFLPMLLLSGEMGMFIKIIPIIITILLLASLFEAFYFLPLHAYDFLKVSHTKDYAKGVWHKLSQWHSKILYFLFKKQLISLIAMTVLIIFFNRCLI
jgi:multidrug efflux pump subunit AcrB